MESLSKAPNSGGGAPALIRPMRVQRHPVLDAHRIAPRVWLGALPPAARLPQLGNMGFDTLAVCAVEHQDHASGPLLPLRLAVVQAPLPDGDAPLTPAAWAAVDQAAWRLANAHRGGGRLLITSLRGADRAGLVAARTLSLLSPRTPLAQIVDHIRRHRKVHARLPLRNERHVLALEPGRHHAPDAEPDFASPSGCGACQAC